MLHLINLSVVTKLFCFLLKMCKFISVDFPLCFSLFIVDFKHLNVQFVFCFDGHGQLNCSKNLFKLFKKFIRKKSPTLKAKYNMARNVYFHFLQAKKSNYYALLFEKNKFNMKATWKIISKLLGKGKVASCSSLVVDNRLLTLLL